MAGTSRDSKSRYTRGRWFHGRGTKQHRREATHLEATPMRKEPSMGPMACVNGRFSTIEEASIPINDRGLLFGDSVYEVMVAVDGLLWCADAHVMRLERSLKAIEIVADVEKVRQCIAETVIRSGLRDAVVYVQITRGVADRSHLPTDGIEPTVIVTVRPRHDLDADTRQRGVSVLLVEETRWARRDIKSTNLLPNVLAQLTAKQQDADEALFVEADGTVNEGSSKNVFVVKNGRIETPQLGSHILAGITRQTVLRAAANLEIPIQEHDVSRDDVLDADEVFVSSTTSDVLGVTRVNDTVIGDGVVGPITIRLYDEYLAAARRTAVTPADFSRGDS